MHYVIGDVHGCYDELMSLINKIEANDSEAQFILVGDLIDRGPKVWEVLTWAMEHITPNGKYQSVRGNHEQLAMDWFREYKVWYEENDEEEAPRSHYDISRVLQERVYPTGRHAVHTPEDFQAIMSFFETLPYYKQIMVTNSLGWEVPYRIVHGWYDFREGDNTVMQHHANLWERNYWGGRSDADEIIIFGHTPTVAHDFNLRGAGIDMPGFICYRQNSINVDCGCVYGNRDAKYPYMLGAICLETLEEIYPWNFEERMLQLVQKNDTLFGGISKELYVEIVMEDYRERYGKCKLEDNFYRRKMKERFHFVDGGEEPA
ncbi:MAG: serine/threonine protein phosphatase [Lachnospiraceae bacterium]|nr:serine/threonine protein phosphatase [Lachnospiraceae bacterium]